MIATALSNHKASHQKGLKALCAGMSPPGGTSPTVEAAKKGNGLDAGRERERERERDILSKWAGVKYSSARSLLI